MPSSFYKTTDIHFFFNANLSHLKVTPKLYQEVKIIGQKQESLIIQILK